MSEWEAATFEGARSAQRRDLAATTPQERLRWLAAAREVAAASGALQTELDRRAAAQIDRWEQGRGTPALS